MTRTSKLEQVKLWCRIQEKARWWNFWERGYVRACKDILLLIESEDIVLVALSEYRAVEGHYEGWPYP